MVRQMFAPAFAPVGQHASLLVQHIVASMHIVLWSDCKGNMVKFVQSGAYIPVLPAAHIAGRHMCGV